MDAKGRENFWNVLKCIHDNTEQNARMLTAASPWPKILCRFRTVSESHLRQLNDNMQFFSSADHYDDPFDTYFYINVAQMVPAYEEFRKQLLEGNQTFIDKLRPLAAITGQNLDQLVRNLSDVPLNFEELNGRLDIIRELMQKRMFSICFSENPYNETLWLKYAENYSGFVQIYNLEDPNTFLCGKENSCKCCKFTTERPYIYPVYYSDIKYDATKYATYIWLTDFISRKNDINLFPLFQYLYNEIVWEAERISLIKKKCHEYDGEWRMIRPAIMDKRTGIKMKPCKVIIGLRTPEYESKLIISAAVNAGIKEIHKLYINASDELDSRPVSAELYHI